MSRSRHHLCRLYTLRQPVDFGVYSRHHWTSCFFLPCTYIVPQV
nr:MAG TPA: hypothetical protein [Caudoviricetes sp.]